MISFSNSNAKLDLLVICPLLYFLCMLCSFPTCLWRVIIVEERRVTLLTVKLRDSADPSALTRRRHA